MQTEVFPTGAQREKKGGKGRYDLISPRFLRRLALTLEEGASKHGDRNWEKGIPSHSYLDSLLRHICQWVGGDRSEDHLGHAAFNLQGLIFNEEMVVEGRLPVELDDLPGSLPFSDSYLLYGLETEAPLRTDLFLGWLEDGPHLIEATFDHFRAEGWTDDEILEVKDALIRAGKVDYYAGDSYCTSEWRTDCEKLDSDVHSEEILSFKPIC